MEGKLDQLITRVIAVNKQAGPFDALFCVGSFFSPSSSSSSSSSSELSKFIDKSLEGTSI